MTNNEFTAKIASEVFLTDNLFKRLEALFAIEHPTQDNLFEINAIEVYLSRLLAAAENQTSEC